MTDERQRPTAEQIKGLFEEFLPLDQDLDPATARIILERAGVDRVAFSQRLKSRLERRTKEIRASGKKVPAGLLRVIDVL
jgi:hypothetical protein